MCEKSTIFPAWTILFCSLSAHTHNLQFLMKKFSITGKLLSFGEEIDSQDILEMHKKCYYKDSHFTRKKSLQYLFLKTIFCKDTIYNYHVTISAPRLHRRSFTPTYTRKENIYTRVLSVIYDFDCLWNKSVCVIKRNRIRLFSDLRLGWRIMAAEVSDSTRLITADAHAYILFDLPQEPICEFSIYKNPLVIHTNAL